MITKTLAMGRPLRLLLLLVFFTAGSLAAQPQDRPAALVDPFIGTVNCRWFFFTPAALPFGMARLGPHTNAHYGNASGWEPVGYDYRDHSIEGFGHFHEFQVGGLVFMPTTGPLRTIPGDTGKGREGYRSAFDHVSETAQPGYYAVTLKDYHIRAELSATRRVGFHRYHFPAGQAGHVLIDVGHTQGESGPVTDAWVRKRGAREIEGAVTTLPEYVRSWDSSARVTMYFVAEFEHPLRQFGTFRGDTVAQGRSEVHGRGCGMYVSFGADSAHTETIRVGLSYVSVENARLNLHRESDGLSFDQCREQAFAEWDRMLSRIRAYGGKHSDQVKFYTALYHALSGRGVSSDVNGEYPRLGGGIGHIPLDAAGKPLYAHYNSDASWGVFWNLQLLWGLAYPGILNDFIRAHLDHYRDMGWLPDGVAAGALTPGMPSNFLGLMIASAYNRGIRHFPVEEAYQAARKNELDWHQRPAAVGKYDLEDFIRRGYIPIENTFKGYKFSASHTLEYAFSSWGVGQMALALGKTADYRRLNAMGRHYRNIFDPTIRMMRARDSLGRFVQNFTPTQVWNGFQEGNSWQYSWYAPQDIPGLMDLMGRETFNRRLDSLFTASAKNLFGGGKVLHSFSGLEAVYNQGNQPCLVIPYLFNFSGKPWRTQYWVRQIMDVFYGDTPLHGYGYGQDEDQGQLGAWYVLGAIGLFDVQGGASLHPTMQISAPLFDSIRIQLDKRYFPGDSLEIIAPGAREGDRYIRAAQFRGRPLKQPWVDFRALTQGGRLVYRMGATPDTTLFSSGSPRP